MESHGTVEMTARGPRIALGCLAFVAILLTSLAASAKRAVPAMVAPIVVRLEVASATPLTKELPVDRPECRDGSSDAYFFPAGWLGERSPRFDEDQSRRRWYSKVLRAMAEPSLSCPRKGGDAIRFLWLRTWGRPIVVRVESSNGGAVISAVVLDGAGGYEPGKISRRVRRELTDAERRRLAASLDDLHFFEMPTHDGDGGLDGAQSILEGRMGARYHVTDRWSPEDGPYRELCLSMLKLADLLPSGNGKDGIY